MQRTPDIQTSKEALAWLRSQLSWEFRLQQLRDRAEDGDLVDVRKAA
jgi:hypothetical protein